LKKGYTILFSEKDQSVISTLQMLHPDQRVRMLFADGEAAATVTELFPRD
jgi:exodeoxyribonuclease VII large subunit